MFINPTVLTVRVIVSVFDSRAWQSLGFTRPAPDTAEADPLTVQPVNEQPAEEPKPLVEKLLETITTAPAPEGGTSWVMPIAAKSTPTAAAVSQRTTRATRTR
jgi:hypothetical protein